jgi:hypothetical protein
MSPELLPMNKKRPPATATYKMDPELLAKCKQLVPWLKGDMLKQVAPELLPVAGEKSDGVSIADYIDYLIRGRIEQHHALIMEHIASQQRRKKPKE